MDPLRFLNKVNLLEEESLSVSTAGLYHSDLKERSLVDRKLMIRK